MVDIHLMENGTIGRIEKRERVMSYILYYVSYGLAGALVST
jgi:hypothetical protein